MKRQKQPKASTTERPKSNKAEFLAERIGNTIRKIRLSQTRTQEDLAKCTGFTKSLISKIESGNVTPPVATLVAIATALGTTVSTLIESGTNKSTIPGTAAEVLDGLVLTEQGYWIYPFASGHHGKKMQPMFMVAHQGEVKEHHFRHSGEEFMYVLDGSMWVEVGKEKHRLETGGSIYFDSNEPHQVVPITPVVKYLNIFL